MVKCHDGLNLHMRYLFNFRVRLNKQEVIILHYEFLNVSVGIRDNFDQFTKLSIHI